MIHDRVCIHDTWRTSRQTERNRGILYCFRSIYLTHKKNTNKGVCASPSPTWVVRAIFEGKDAFKVQTTVHTHLGCGKMERFEAVKGAWLLVLPRMHPAFKDRGNVRITAYKRVDTVLTTTPTAGLPHQRRQQQPLCCVLVMSWVCQIQLTSEVSFR